MDTNKKKVTAEDIKTYLEEIYGHRKPERKIKVHRYCPNKGWIDGFDFCGDRECPSCSFLLDLFDEEIKKISTVDLGKPFLIEMNKEWFKNRKNEESTDNGD